MTLRIRPMALALAALALAAACSSNPAPPVPVQGSDLSALSGRWIGDYSSTETGRSGSIVFELRSGDKTAHGDVLMKPRQDGGSTSTPSTSEALRTMPQMLNISFVSATGGTLRGTMDPYRDPECDCQVQTTFVGSFAGKDKISGTFTTTPQGAGTISTGRWMVSRENK
jgi:hypothetical protein